MQKNSNLVPSRGSINELDIQSKHLGNLNHSSSIKIHLEGACFLVHRENLGLVQILDPDAGVAVITQGNDGGNHELQTGLHDLQL